MRHTPCLLFGFLSLSLLPSCSMYHRDFDCPPAPGIACTPVTTLEKMIIEAPCGEEAFTGCVPKLVEIHSQIVCKHAEPFSTDVPFQRRIWFAPKTGKASYLYFDEEMECEAL